MFYHPKPRFALPILFHLRIETNAVAMARLPFIASETALTDRDATAIQIGVKVPAWAQSALGKIGNDVTVDPNRAPIRQPPPRL